MQIVLILYNISVLDNIICTYIILDFLGNAINFTIIQAVTVINKKKDLDEKKNSIIIKR